VRNDDHNTFEHVARTLARFIPGVTLARGHEIANVIHSSGQAIVLHRHAGDRRALLGAAQGAGLTMAPSSSAELRRLALDDALRSAVSGGAPLPWPLGPVGAVWISAADRHVPPAVGHGHLVPAGVRHAKGGVISGPDQ